MKEAVQNPPTRHSPWGIFWKHVLQVERPDRARSTVYDSSLVSLSSSESDSVSLSTGRPCFGLEAAIVGAVVVDVRREVGSGELEVHTADKRQREGERRERRGRKGKGEEMCLSATKPTATSLNRNERN